MEVLKAVSLNICVKVPDHHTEDTGPVAADAALRMMLAGKLPGEEYANCEIVKVDEIQNIHIETLEIIK